MNKTEIKNKVQEPKDINKINIAEKDLNFALNARNLLYKTYIENYIYIIKLIVFH